MIAFFSGCRYWLLLITTIFTVAAAQSAVAVSAIPEVNKAIASPSLAVATQSSSDVSKKSTNNKKRPLDLFNEVIRKVKQDYVQETNDDILAVNAIQGVVAGLDPHSAYLDPQTYAQTKEAATGQFPGIGLEFATYNKLIRVISPYEGGPAFQAGIKSGDIITSIDDVPVINMDIAQAAAMLKGEPNSKVKLSVYRENGEHLNFTIVRDFIRVMTVQSSVIPDGPFLYVRLSSFNNNTTEDLLTQYNDHSRANKIAGVIIDLRSNPGGLLDQGIAVANLFLSRGRIVTVKHRDPTLNQTYSSSGEDITHGLPIVILINNGSASAAELIAAALRDNKRALLVGTKSFGKGSIQDITPLSNGGAISMTTALYYTPSGRAIQGIGIAPDIYVPESAIVREIAPIPGSITSEAQFKTHIRSDNKESLPTPAQDVQPLTTIIGQQDKDFQLLRAIDVLKTLAFIKSGDQSTGK